MLLAALPVSASAATPDEQERICKQIATIYRRTLSATGADSLRGYCGMMAGWELYLMGITTTAVTQNGNEMYDILKDSDQIADGYTPVCYPATDYSLESALNAVCHNGTKDVYNIMLGFQWTSTAAGQLYGHVTIVHAILDGMMYFTEGFVTPFQSDPSQAMVCTIQEFANHYNTWTRFEGLIHFDNGVSVAGCETMACDLYVAGNTDITLLSKPDFLDVEECRRVSAGERLHATALCWNMDGVLFYQIKEENNWYYIPSGQVVPVWFDGTKACIHDAVLPEKMEPESKLSGIIRSEGLAIASVAVGVTGQNGETVLYRETPASGTSVNLNTINLDLGALAEGSYTLSIYCDLENPYSIQGEVIRNLYRTKVSETVFTVGDAVAAPQTAPAAAEAVKNGWQYENDCWYYYENGFCRTGWFCDNGIDYYLLSDGAAATGWQEINGKSRYFSETGAMRTGWLEAEEGTCYMLSNGAAAVGTLTIDGLDYTFDENGLLITE